jgi:hypothetical protein
MKVYGRTTKDKPIFLEEVSSLQDFFKKYARTTDECIDQSIKHISRGKIVSSAGYLLYTCR